MKHRMSTILTALVVALLLNGARAEDPPTDVAATATTQSASATSNPADAKAAWLKSLSAGQSDAQNHRRLIIVKAGAVWCGWCRRLDAELSDKTLQVELAKWTCVEIDVDQSKADARKLGIGPVPALRILRPDGRVAASQDGYMAAAELAKWLETERARIDLNLDDELTRQGPPSEQALAALIKAFAAQDAATREAAVRRIIPHAVTATAVVDAFIKGNLAMRLSALDVLSEWKAPIGELDPWNPESITPQRSEELVNWAAALKDLPAPTTQAVVPDALLASLDAFMRATSDSEAGAIAERLVRQRDVLLPLVYERLKDAPTDQIRTRLTRLRYRLAASNERALKWPDGLARLASDDLSARRAAVNELAESATDADVSLLTELFGDSEPMVREISLKALHKVGGAAAADSLTRLLADPDANVRAAVLKELAAKPDATMVTRVIAYIGNETDADLIVHAIHVLSASGNDEAVKCLIGLKSHERWQVRAEATEAIGHAVQQSNLSMTMRDAATTALADMLADSDSFVVSRAFQALSTGNSAPKLTLAQIEGLIDRHPDLAVEAVMMVVGGKDLFESMSRMREMGDEIDFQSGSYEPKLDPNAVQNLRALSANKLPAVRAKAVSLLADIAPKRASKALKATIADCEPAVRIAAAGALLQVMQSYRPRPRDLYGIESYEEQAMPSGGGGLLGAIFGSRPSRRTVAKPPKPAASQPTLAWPESFKAGEGRPKWMAEIQEPLRAMLHAQSAEERAVAAAPAIALGHEGEALAVLTETVRADVTQANAAASALPWLTSANRGTLLETMLALKLSSETFVIIAERLSSVRDEVTAATLWRLLESADLPADAADTIFEGLTSAYVGEPLFVYGDFPEQPEKKSRLVGEATARVSVGGDVQRLVALSLLARAQPETAITHARTVFESPEISESLRRDAFHILLLCQDKSKALNESLNVLEHPDVAIRRLALQCVAQEGGIEPSIGNGIYINSRVNEYNEYMVVRNGDRGKVIRVEPIAGVDPAKIQPFLSDTEPETRGYAAYILATHKDGSHIDEIAKFWRERGKYDQSWKRMLWRAIAAADADDKTPVLEELYAALGKSDYFIRDFYWTVRSMTGAKAKAFRKKVYKEVEKYMLE